MIAVRHYLIPDDGSIKRLSKRVIDGLQTGDDRMPDLASTRQRFACVVVRHEDRKPVAILDIKGVYWTFDAKGGVDELEQRRVAGDAMEFAFARPVNTKGKIVSLAPALKRRAFEAEHRWEPSKDEIDRIALDLWPDANGPVGTVETVKSKVPAKPPLTWEGEKALHEIAGVLFNISMALDNLSEKALKGLAFEARRNTSFEDDGPIWTGIAEEADRRREIAARRRTGKGAWYAIVEGWADDPLNRHLTRHVDIVHERCESQKAAVETARRLLAENAHRFSADVRIEASVKCELEWQPAED